MDTYLKFLVLLKANCKHSQVTSLVALTEEVGINHNAAIAAHNLEFVKKRKDGTYKWVGKSPKQKHADVLRSYTNSYTQFNAPKPRKIKSKIKFGY